MMNFDNLFNSIDDIMDTALKFSDGQPVYYISNGKQTSYTFRYDEFKVFAEQKIMSANNNTMCFIADHTMYVLPRNLGNATEILKNTGYRWGQEQHTNNYYVPLSNGETFNPFEQNLMRSKWQTLQYIADATINNY